MRNLYYEENICHKKNKSLCVKQSLLVLLNYVCVIKFHSQINSVIGFHIINNIVEKNIISVEIKIYIVAYSRKARGFLFVY